MATSTAKKCLILNFLTEESAFCRTGFFNDLFLSPLHFRVFFYRELCSKVLQEALLFFFFFVLLLFLAWSNFYIKTPHDTFATSLFFIITVYSANDRLKILSKNHVRCLSIKVLFDFLNSENNHVRTFLTTSIFPRSLSVIFLFL